MISSERLEKFGPQIRRAISRLDELRTDETLPARIRYRAKLADYHVNALRWRLDGLWCSMQPRRKRIERFPFGRSGGPLDAGTLADSMTGEAEVIDWLIKDIAEACPEFSKSTERASEAILRLMSELMTRSKSLRHKP